MSSHVSDRLSPFVDGELTPDERGQVEAHLRDCPECAHELAGLVELDAMARELPVSAPEGYFESFPARVRERLKPRPARPIWRHWTWAAAAALLLAVLTPLTMKDKGVQAPTTVEAPAAPPGPGVMGEAAREPAPGKAPLPDATAPQEGRISDELRARREAQRSTVPEVETAAREKQKEQSAAAKLAAAPPPATAPRPVEPAATPAPRANEGFAPPPAESGAGAPPPPRDERPRKSAAPPTPWGGEQRGPRAQAQVPSSTQVPQGGFVQDLEKTKPRPKPERQAAAEPKRDDQAGFEAAKKTEESVEKDGAKTDADARAALGYSASRAAQSSDEALYRSLAERPVPSAAAARELREAWRAYLRAHPQSPRADLVRVRIIEASVAAWRLGDDAADREAARRDAGAYLLRADAARKERVRELLGELGP